MSESPILYYQTVGAGLMEINYTGRWMLKQGYNQPEPELFIEHKYIYDDDSYGWISEKEIIQRWPIVGERL